MASNIKLSEKFINVISKMKSNKIALELISLKHKSLDVEFTQNYIDAGESKDEVTFISNRKIKEIMGDDGVKHVVANRVKTLSHSPKNKVMFKRLGYIPTTELQYKPSVGQLGFIRAEATSVFSNNSYVLFVTEDGRQSVINKSSLAIHRDNKEALLWTKNRNPIKVGRLVRSILGTIKYEFVEKDIEDFVNAYKSTYDIVNNAHMKFDVVKGDDISFWYNNSNYEEGGRSTLGGSCMAGVHKSYFDIYAKNSQCSLVILYGDEDGEVINGKYKSTKIKGRALLWKTDQGDIFMDRIYTNHDNDVNLFMSFANENGWWYKSCQNTATSFTAYSKELSKNPMYTITLDESKFNHYPYLDTFSIINFDSNIITNNANVVRPQANLHSTSGYMNTCNYFSPNWPCNEEVDEDEDYDEDNDGEDDDLPY